jgi:hypothetical protein
VIALSGVLEVDPQRPLAFSIVTNTVSPLSKPLIRRAHEQVLAEITRYLAKTSSRLAPVPPQISPPVAPSTPAPLGADEPEETEPEAAALDHETATQH